MYYRPLPDYLDVLRSEYLSNITGKEEKGLFAIDDIDKGHIIGITHIEDEEFPNGYSRTPLGGFYNHNTTPNCETIIDGRFLKLKTLRDIKNGEELTCKYFFYDPTTLFD
jgi:hypothetical protein